VVHRISFKTFIILLFSYAPLQAVGFGYAAEAINKMSDTVAQLPKQLQELSQQINTQLQNTIAGTAQYTQETLTHTTNNIQKIATQLSEQLQQFPRMLVHSLKSIPIMALGFGGACYALWLLKQGVEELVSASQEESKDTPQDVKKRQQLTFASCCLLLASLCVIAKSDAIIGVF
jgi:predicted PurR-regulated permease PerM